MSSYRIVEHTYSDPVNNPQRYGDKYYTIQEKIVSPFSIIKRLTRQTKTWSDWECITDPDFSPQYNPLRFKTYRQAREALEKLLNGEVVKGWKEKVIKEFETEY
jgi:hypothetical protein